MPVDFKKSEKELYQPKTKPAVIDVPEMTFIAIDGKGDPNNSGAYAAAIETLYGFSYAIKMGNKSVLEYVVPPLEGFWTVKGGAAIADKSKFLWTVLIRQPDFATEEVFAAAAFALAQKKPNLDLAPARLTKIKEGLCVQAMHIGPYDDEPATVAMLEQYAGANGYAIDLSATRRHHEIYLSDPRKTAPEKLKTVIRLPIRKA
ncbi:MAG: GyrI-like domain-containing protein [Firmicutes bacterium]|nr:GyrI-like domain-containing protein [Bacillota bacterium]